MSRQEATEKLLDAKKKKGVTFEEIAAVVGGDKVWIASVMFGQNSMEAEQARNLAEYLELGSDVAESIQECPMKGDLNQTVPIDPLIYRFYEITQCYGSSMKAIIHEMFGDGIMSAIDFSIDISKKEDPKGDRVVVTFDGKFLPYRKW